MTEAKERLDVQDCEDRLQVALHNQRFDFVLQQFSRAESVLEIGTGVGGFSAALAAHAGRYTGLEFDAESAALTRKRLPPTAEVLQGDARRLPFEPQSFSVIVCLEVLEHLGDFKAGVAGIHRCLKPEGVGIISVPYRRRGGTNPSNRYHLYEPGERELVDSLRERFDEASTYYQHFPESWILSAARWLHLRRLLGWHRSYSALAHGEAQAVSRLRIDPQGRGMRMHLVVVVRRPRRLDSFK